MSELQASSVEGGGRTFAVVHRMDEGAAADYEVVSGAKAVPVAALRAASAKSSPPAGCPYGFGATPKAETAASAEASKSIPPAGCPYGFGATPKADTAASEAREASNVPKCPLGFGAAPAKGDESGSLPSMTLVQLGRHNGRIPGMPTFVSVRGIILDVTGPGPFAPGGKLSGCTGHDCSRLLAVGDFDESLLDRRLNGLSFDDQKRLASYEQALKHHYKAVARLAEDEFYGLFGESPAAGPRAGMPSTEDSIAVRARAAEVHAAIEAGNAALVCSLVEKILTATASSSSQSASVANALCVRTGMPPLHKALEHGFGFTAVSDGPGTASVTEGAESVSDLVCVLVALLRAGADPSLGATLYDGADAVLLAALFGRAGALNAALAQIASLREGALVEKGEGD